MLLLCRCSPNESVDGVGSAVLISACGLVPPSVVRLSLRVFCSGFLRRSRTLGPEAEFGPPLRAISSSSPRLLPRLKRAGGEGRSQMPNRSPGEDSLLGSNCCCCSCCCCRDVGLRKAEGVPRSNPPKEAILPSLGVVEAFLGLETTA